MIPRVSFIVWIALHKGLNTDDRLQQFGPTLNPICPFCRDPVESHSLLFFNCMFSARVWSALKTKCNVNWPDLHWPNLITLATKETKGRSLRSHILRLSLLCSIYHIWLQRNNRIINKEFKPEEVVIKSIIHMIKGRLLSINNLPRSTGDGWFLAHWNLSVTVLKPI